jgi:MarR family transcriptional regulator, organic hydroperoxide resistance regulator
LTRARRQASPPRDDEVLQLDRQLCFAAYSVSQAFTRAFKPRLDAMGLTYPQYLALLVLWEKDDQTLKQIGEHLRLDSGTLTPLLKRLEAAGFVRRMRDPDDERHVRVRLTPHGARLRAKAAEAGRAVGCGTGLTPHALQALRDELIDVRDRLDRSTT